MKTPHRQRWSAWLAVLCCAAPAWALAQDAGDKNVLAQARTEAAQQYQAALAQCGRLPVRDKDVCQWTAKAERTKREHRAEARYTGTPQAAHVARFIDIRESGCFRSGINVHSWFAGTPRRHQRMTEIAEEAHATV